ncbi:Hypothetical protein NTJ_07396 [Nesidiocoris tenuis]|uniref:Cytochrome b-c1 complex subunit 7 n=1 Tax=Nesidiocoris tenuis TaxID=355587 RepID=A0ABN7AQU9_9HEMI|nr:Hypothetical protein NTJ_07396 [Nesidiocoris tenuis]
MQPLPGLMQAAGSDSQCQAIADFFSHSSGTLQDEKKTGKPFRRRTAINLFVEMAARHLATKAAQAAASPFRKWVYNASGFNKYGLMHDDLLYETPDVKQALKRLPEDLLHQRSFRIVRAMQLSMTHDILPKEQWTKFEEDVKYLQPYIDEVRREREEREEWESNN